jgi:hypothetical protein
MAVVDFCDEKMTRAHKRAVRAKNRALDFGRNGARTLSFCRQNHAQARTRWARSWFLSHPQKAAENIDVAYA